MTSNRERQQRAAARARLAREMAERQAAAKRRRQRKAIAGAGVAVLLVAAGTVWAVTAATGDNDPLTPAADATPTTAPLEHPGECVWEPVDPTRYDMETLTDVGTPEEPEELPTGTATLALETNRGEIEIEMDAGAAPCTYLNFAHLAEENFYDETVCHRQTDYNPDGQGFIVLQCGDPTASGQGGPTYRFLEENLPVDAEPYYPRGTVAMAKGQEPATTGSQFFFVYEDIPQQNLPPDYTVVGTVTEGMDIVDEVVEGGFEGQAEGADQGFPLEELELGALRVGEPE